MSQRPLLGAYTGNPIAVVREHGSRMECIGLVPWLMPQTLAHISDYWVGDFSLNHEGPAWSVIETFHSSLTTATPSGAA